VKNAILDNTLVSEAKKKEGKKEPVAILRESLRNGVCGGTTAMRALHANQIIIFLNKKKENKNC
jgi:hypothetical protein